MHYAHKQEVLKDNFACLYSRSILFCKVIYPKILNLKFTFFLQIAPLSADMCAIGNLLHYYFTLYYTCNCYLLVEHTKLLFIKKLLLCVIEQYNICWGYEKSNLFPFNKNWLFRIQGKFHEIEILVSWPLLNSFLFNRKPRFKDITRTSCACCLFYCISDSKGISIRC